MLQLKEILVYTALVSLAIGSNHVVGQVMPLGGRTGASGSAGVSDQDAGSSRSDVYNGPVGATTTGSATTTTNAQDRKHRSDREYDRVHAAPDTAPRQGAGSDNARDLGVNAGVNANINGSNPGVTTRSGVDTDINQTTGVNAGVTNGTSTGTSTR